MRSIYILLTRSGTIVSRAVYLVTRDDFTHASMALDGDLYEMYSATRKNGRTLFPAGPCREYLRGGYFRRAHRIPCALFELQVDEETYQRVRQEVDRVMLDADRYRYNIAGLVMCQLRIPSRRRYHLFCSQFICQVLQRAGALELPKDASLMKPNDCASLPGLNCLFRGRLTDLMAQKQIPHYAFM